jgi:hypothetical protein
MTHQKRGSAEHIYIHTRAYKKSGQAGRTRGRVVYKAHEDRCIVAAHVSTLFQPRQIIKAHQSVSCNNELRWCARCKIQCHVIFQAFKMLNISSCAIYIFLLLLLLHRSNEQQSLCNVNFVSI